MFNRDKKVMVAALELAKAQIEQHEKTISELIAANEELSKRAFIIGMEREGRIMKFTFMRNGELYQIETISQISDNLPEWKAKLL